MLAVLSRMAGLTPESGSERREHPAPGYASFDNLLTAIGQQTTEFKSSLADLKDTLRSENAVTRSLVETYHAESNRRLEALEAWRNEEQIEDAVRRGRLAMFMLAFHWMTEHWQVVWALVFLITTIFWRLSGTPAVGVGPIQQ